MNGAGFVSLVRTYIGAINGGAVPSLADAWTSAVQTQCAQVREPSIIVGAIYFSTVPNQ